MRRMAYQAAVSPISLETVDSQFFASNDFGIQALFFDVMTENADQRCSTFLLPQCGQRTSPSS